MIIGCLFARCAPQEGESEPEEKTVQLTADVPLTRFGSYQGGEIDKKGANAVFGIDKPGLLVEIIPEHEGEYRFVFIPKPSGFFSPNGPYDDLEALFYEPYGGKKTLCLIFTGSAEEKPIAPIGGKPATVFIADKSIRLFENPHEPS